MKRGAVVSRYSERGQSLQRVLITRRYELAHVEATCLGCGLCADVCPLGAVSLAPAVVSDGQLQNRARPALVAEKCNFCGECAVICPSHSLRLTIDGAARLPVVEAEAFPRLLAAVEVAVERCRPDCGLACAEACPVEGALSVSAEAPEGKVERIADIAVDEDKCFYCGKCEVACPAEGALHVRKPFEGAIGLTASLCPEGCRACADACPSEALAYTTTGVAVDERNCFYCGACLQACPVEGALVVRRNRVAHTPVKSAAWTTALGKILSPAVQARELEALARRRAREAAAGLLGLG